MPIGTVKGLSDASQICRCETTTSLSGEAAWDYADLHLQVEPVTIEGCVAVYRCGHTGFRWCETRAGDGDVALHRM